MLQGKEWIVITGFSAGVLVVSVLLWSMLEISVAIVLVAADVDPVVLLNISVVGVNSV